MTSISERQLYTDYILLQNDIFNLGIYFLRMVTNVTKAGSQTCTKLHKYLGQKKPDDQIQNNKCLGHKWKYSSLGHKHLSPKWQGHPCVGHQQLENKRLCPNIRVTLVWIKKHPNNKRTNHKRPELKRQGHSVSVQSVHIYPGIWLNEKNTLCK